jgi:hypothetical protein
MQIQHLSLLKKTLYIGWILLLPLLVLTQGYLWGVGGPNYFTNIFSIIVIFLITISFAIRGVTITYFNYILLAIIFICWVSTYAVTLGGQFRDDTQALTRSILLFTFVYTYLRQQNKEVCFLIVKVLVVLWGSITILILISSLNKLGLQTYPNFNSGWKFYFPATNELSYVYFSTFIVTSFCCKSIHHRLFVIVMTIFTFLVIGTKVFIPLFATYLLLSFITYARKNNYKLIFTLGLVIPIALLTFLTFYFEQIATFIAEAFIGTSGGAGTLENKIIVRGVTSAILGERDILISLALKYINESYTVLDLLIGKTISIYSTDFAVYRGLTGPGWIENDLFDLFCAYGIIGVISYLFIIFRLSHIYLLFSFSKKFCKLDSLKLIQCSTLFIAGALSGHVLFFTFPMFITALILGLRDLD